MRGRWSATIVAMGFLQLTGVASAEPIPTTPGPQLAVPELVVSMPNGFGGYGIGSDGSDGVWFNDIELDRQHGQKATYLTHYSPRLPSIRRVPLAPEPPGQNGVWGIAPGLNGEELFLQFYENQLAQVTSAGRRKGKALPEALGGPQDLIVDVRGNVWYLSRAHGCVLVHATPKGKILGSTVIGGDCYTLTIGPDGNIWVAAYTANLVREVSASTEQMIATYTLRLPVGIATLGDSVYVTETEPGAVAKIAPDGTVTEYALPAPRKLGLLTAGADGAVWFSELEGPDGKAGVGRLTPTGELSELSAPSGPLVSTPDALYFLGESDAHPALIREAYSNFVAPAPSYVALGDSYSSGEGNAPYEAGTDDYEEPADLCHRSAAAYGRQLDTMLGIGLMIFRACSGAVTNDIFEASQKNPTEPAQRHWLSESIKTITLTIGGNDAGFSSVLKDCVNVHVPFYPPGFGCSTRSEPADETQDRLSALGGGAPATTPTGAPIHAILSVLQALQASAPNAHIYVGLYPQLFGEDTADYQIDPSAPRGRACEVGELAGEGLMIDYRDAKWLDGLARQLNSIITKAVRNADKQGIAATAVKVPTFHGHGFCDQSDRWFYPLELEIQHPFEAGTTLAPKPSSFHPTSTGQLEGYGAAFAAKLK